MMKRIMKYSENKFTLFMNYRGEAKITWKDEKRTVKAEENRRVRSHSSGFFCVLSVPSLNLQRIHVNFTNRFLRRQLTGERFIGGNIEYNNSAGNAESVHWLH